MYSVASRRPRPDEYQSEYVGQLIDAIGGEDVLQVLQEQLQGIGGLSGQISTDQVDAVHPPYEWTVRQVMQHLADAERIFGYRMLRLAAGDEIPLPAWDEKAYADARFGLGGGFAGLLDELSLLRQANLLLLRRIDRAAWDHVALVSGSRITVRSVAWLTAGHFQHHLRIVQRRLGTAAGAW